MPQQVVATAALTCTFGMGPSTLTVIPQGQPVMASDLPAATIVNNLPVANIAPFPMCASPANPTVIAATAAKLGVFSPAACVPVFPAPWAPGNPTVMINGVPALNSTSVCVCMWGGVVSVSSPGQVTVED